LDENAKGSDQGTESPSPPKRRYGATRVMPRVEFGREKPSSAPVTPEVLEPGMRDEPGMGAPYGDRDPFGPRTLAGGRVRLYGCSPGCLIASVLVSLLLTLLLNALI